MLKRLPICMLIRLHTVLRHLHTLLVIVRREWVEVFGGYGLTIFRWGGWVYRAGSRVFCEIGTRYGMDPVFLEKFRHG